MSKKLFTELSILVKSSIINPDDPQLIYEIFYEETEGGDVYNFSNVNINVAEPAFFHGYINFYLKRNIKAVLYIEENGDENQEASLSVFIYNFELKNKGIFQSNREFITNLRLLYLSKRSYSISFTFNPLNGVNDSIKRIKLIFYE